MGFMEPDIARMSMVHIETTHGTETVPLDICGEATLEALADYLTGTPVLDGDGEPNIVTREGFYGRLSAPGYLDATDWMGPYRTERACALALTEMYGDDDA